MYLKFDLDLGSFSQQSLYIIHILATESCIPLSSGLLYTGQGLLPSVGPIFSHPHRAPWPMYATTVDSNVLGTSPLEKMWEWLFSQREKKRESIHIPSSISPTADKDKHGFRWSRISQMCINVSMLQEAITSGSLGCQFKSLTTRVWAFRLCVVCNS